jgi:hypothetical protein
LRHSWYSKLLEETEKGFSRNASGESLHASLIALGELLEHAGTLFILILFGDWRIQASCGKIIAGKIYFWRPVLRYSDIEIPGTKV